VAVDIEQSLAVLALEDDMRVPDLVEQGGDGRLLQRGGDGLRDPPRPHKHAYLMRDMRKFDV
jgi:hypothetical protein